MTVLIAAAAVVVYAAIGLATVRVTDAAELTADFGWRVTTVVVVAWPLVYVAGLLLMAAIAGVLLWRRGQVMAMALAGRDR